MTGNKKKLFIVAGLAVVIIGLIILYVFRPGVKCVCHIKSIAEISSAEIVSRYESDENEANTEFLGKVVTVLGSVADCTKDEQNRMIVILESESVGQVRCTLCPTESEIAEITFGTQVKVKGECVGYALDVILIKGCVDL
jgi:hypothetical protein